MRLFDIKTKLAISNLNTGSKFNIFTLLILMGCTSSCAVYSAGFNCADSRGARCVMLSEVDKRIDSGEIETVYMDKKCKDKGSCNTDHNNVPKKALNQVHKVKIIDREEEGLDFSQEGDNLYLK